MRYGTKYKKRTHTNSSLSKGKVDIRLSQKQLNLLQSQKEITFAFGGAGAGKTFAGSFWALNNVIRHPGMMGLISANTYTQLDIATLREFDHVLKDICGLVEGNHYRKSKDRQHWLYKFWNGAEVHAISFEKFDIVEGAEFAWAWCDEMEGADKEVFDILMKRLRANKDGLNPRLITSYTTDPQGWLYKLSVENYNEKMMHVEYLFTVDNIKHLPIDYIENLKAVYDDNQVQRYLFAQWVNLANGKAYYNFDRTRHIAKCEYSPALPLLVSFDFNVNPMTLLVAQEYHDRIHFIDEIVMPNSNIYQTLDEFIQKYGEHRFGIEIYGDASGGYGSVHSNLTLYEIIRAKLGQMADYKEYISRANPSVRERVEIVNAWLKNSKNETRLYFDPRCAKTAIDFENTSWKEGSAYSLDKDNASTTHQTDAVGYLIFNKTHKPVYRTY